MEDGRERGKKKNTEKKCRTVVTRTFDAPDTLLQTPANSSHAFNTTESAVAYQQ
jgi:hypothetical protein